MDDSVLAQRGRLRQKRMVMACSEAALRLSCPSRWNESELTPLPLSSAPGQTIECFLFLFAGIPSLALYYAVPLRRDLLLLRYPESSSMWLLELFGYSGRPRRLQSQHNELLQVLVKRSTEMQCLLLRLLRIQLYSPHSTYIIAD